MSRLANRWDYALEAWHSAHENRPEFSMPHIHPNRGRAADVVDVCLFRC
jgi:hypothetical protein